MAQTSISQKILSSPSPAASSRVLVLMSHKSHLRKSFPSHGLRFASKGAGRQHGGVREVLGGPDDAYPGAAHRGPVAGATHRHPGP